MSRIHPRHGFRYALVRSGLSSRLVQASGLLVVVAAGWFGLAAAGSDPAPLLWAVTPVGAAIVTAIYARTASCIRLPVVTRRFWRHMSLVAALVGLAATVQAVEVLRHPRMPGPHTPPLMLGIDAVAVLVLMWALYRLPLGRPDAAGRLRVLLDAATVMLAAAVFIWHFQTQHAVHTQNGTELTTSAFVIVLALLAVFAVAKVVLAGHVFVDRQALLLLAAGMVVGTIAPLLAAPVEQHAPVYVNQVAIPLVFFLAAWAGQRQRNAARATAPAITARRSFSVLPYAAVAAVDALLMAVIWSGDQDARVVGGVAVLLTGLVVLRQLSTFRDNDRLLRRLDHTASHDALTGLPNRVLFGTRLEQALTDPAHAGITVVLADLDDFKTVNDTLGHAAGDRLLTVTAERLRAALRPADTVARLGGDEFALLLTHPTDVDDLLTAVIVGLREPLYVDGHRLQIRASFGVVSARPGDTGAELIRCADIAMYEAKARGDSSFQHSLPGMQARRAELDLGTAALRHALEQQQLRVHYQPIVELDTGRIAGVEALIRWQHPDRGLLGPDAIIPTAELTNLIDDIGRYVLDQACRQLASWHRQYPFLAPDTVSVNVSARQLHHGGLADDVRAALHRHHVQPGQLIIEITESIALGGGVTTDTLNQLRALGVKIALDDFGTGQSTLTALASCPIDRIKLDRSFVPESGSDVIAAAVLALARGFGGDAVAEGVETTAQADQLRTLGYRYAQGYHFAAPMPAATITTILSPTDPVTAAPAVPFRDHAHGVIAVPDRA